MPRASATSTAPSNAGLSISFSLADASASANDEFPPTSVVSITTSVSSASALRRTSTSVTTGSAKLLSTRWHPTNACSFRSTTTGLSPHFSNTDAKRSVVSRQHPVLYLRMSSGRRTFCPGCPNVAGGTAYEMPRFCTARYTALQSSYTSFFSRR